jgi:hypothetical protein
MLTAPRSAVASYDNLDTPVTAPNTNYRHIRSAGEALNSRADRALGVRARFARQSRCVTGLLL